MTEQGHNNPRIVGVALQRGEKKISMERGRHSYLIRLAIERFGWDRPVRSDEQGFIARMPGWGRDRFVTREEAEPIARAAGQLTGPMIASVLTSEDLW